MLDRMLYDMAVRNIEEKIHEQEIVYNSVDDPAVKRLVDDRITSLKVELGLYRRILGEEK